MTELAALYLAVGVGCAAVSLWSQPRRGLDAAMLLGLWPLLGPLLLARPETSGPPEHGDLAGRAASARARLAELDRALARPELDLEAAAARVAELERAARRPTPSSATQPIIGQSPPDAGLPAGRPTVSPQGGDTVRPPATERALAAARRREQSIRDLAARRKRLAGELEELAELLAQLQTQSEIFRLAGGDESLTDLIADIEARLFGVEQMLEEGR